MAKSVQRYDGIQALRFVAALLVVVTHSTLYTSERLNDSLGIWYRGAVGVDIFFVISGFVMVISTGSLIGRRDGWKFFGMRRLVRIVPMYWIATTVKLATMLILPAAVLHAQLEPAKVAASYLFLPTRNVDGDVHPLLGVGWTLTFEMAFYAIFTIALLVRTNPMWFCGAVLGVLALGNMVRPTGDDWWPGFVYLDPIILYFVVGMVIARWAKDRKSLPLAAWLGGVFALWAVIELFGPNGGGLGQFIQRLVVALGVLAVVAAEPLLTGRIPRPVLYMGDASYSLYLFHPLVAPMVPLALGVVGVTNPVVSVALSVIAAVVVSAGIYRWVEKPLTRTLQKRLPYLRPHKTGTVETVLPPVPASR